MTLPVCGCTGQATKEKSEDPSTDNPVYPEGYSEPRQISKMEEFGKTANG